MKIYMDESGDLGFGKKASPYFIMAALIVKKPLHIKRCITRVRKQKLPKKYKKISELKWHNSSATIKKRIIECLSKTENDVAYAVLRKNQVKKDLRNKPQIVYNYVCGSLISKIISLYGVNTSVDIVVDKSLYGVKRENFDQYITWKALMKSNKDIEMEPPNIFHMDSKQDVCIQAVDFVAGAIHRAYMKGDDFYYKMLEPKISIALDFFEGKNKEKPVSPSLLRPTRLRAASSFSGRTYSPISILDSIFKNFGHRIGGIIKDESINRARYCEG